MGVEIKAEMDNKKVLRLLNDIKKRGGRPPLRRMAVVGTKSVMTNFKVGGRPKWKPLAATKAKGPSRGERRGLPKAKHGAKKKKRSDKPLQDTRRMMQSVHAEYLGLSNIKIATKHPIAPHHQYGTGLHGKNKRKYPIVPVNKKVLSFTTSAGAQVCSLGHLHPGVPARPFIGWQTKDATEIQKILANHLMGMGRAR